MRRRPKRRNSSDGGHRQVHGRILDGRQIPMDGNALGRRRWSATGGVLVVVFAVVDVIVVVIGGVGRPGCWTSRRPVAMWWRWLQGQKERRGRWKRERREERRRPPQQFRSDGLHDGSRGRGRGHRQPVAVFVQVTGHGVVVVHVQAHMVFDVGPRGRWCPARFQRRPSARCHQRGLLLKVQAHTGTAEPGRLMWRISRMLLVLLLMVLVVLLLFLQQTVDLEPVGPPAIPGPALGHAHHQTLAQPTCLARCPILLIDHALAVVLAFGYRTQVVVCPAKERLKHVKSTKISGVYHILRNNSVIMMMIIYNHKSNYRLGIRYYEIGICFTKSRDK